MERRVMGKQEKEHRQPDDVRDLAIKELETQRDAALQIVEQQQLIATNAQDKIEAIYNSDGTPMIVLEVDYLEIEYEKWISTERVTKTEQFAMYETSIKHTIGECANILNGDKDTRLSKVALEVAVNQQLTLIPLQDIAKWQRLLTAQTRQEYSEKAEGMFGGK